MEFISSILTPILYGFGTFVAQSITKIIAVCSKETCIHFQMWYLRRTIGKTFVRRTSGYQSDETIQIHYVHNISYTNKEKHFWIHVLSKPAIPGLENAAPFAFASHHCDGVYSFWSNYRPYGTKRFFYAIIKELFVNYYNSLPDDKKHLLTDPDNPPIKPDLIIEPT